jgi:phosphohistidine phosphatase
MLLYLLRHGEAAHFASAGSDAARPLTAAGIAQLRAAVPAWRRLMVRPERMLCSPLLRARETAAILAEAVDFGSAIEQTAALVPGADPAHILAALEGDMLAGARAVALVGHEPHMGRLLGRLLTGSERGAVPMHTGMLAAVEIEHPRAPYAHLQFVLAAECAQRLA